MNEVLQKRLAGIKEYMHMVIHDMRNPAYLIDASLDELAFLTGIQLEDTLSGKNMSIGSLSPKPVRARSSLENNKETAYLGGGGTGDAFNKYEMEAAPEEMVIGVDNEV